MLNELSKAVEKKGISVVPFYKFNKNILENQMYVDYIHNVVADPSYELFCKRVILIL